MAFFGVETYDFESPSKATACILKLSILRKISPEESYRLFSVVFSNIRERSASNVVQV